MTADAAAEDAVRSLARFHAVAGITCFVGSLVLAIPGVADRLHASPVSWLRSADAPALLLLATAFAALAYGGHQRRPWGWLLALLAYVVALGVAIWLGLQGTWTSWVAVPAAAFMVLLLLTKGVRRVHGIAGPSR